MHRLLTKVAPRFDFAEPMGLLLTYFRLSVTSSEKDFLVLFVVQSSPKHACCLFTWSRLCGRCRGTRDMYIEVRKIHMIYLFVRRSCCNHFCSTFSFTCDLVFSSLANHMAAQSTTACQECRWPSRCHTFDDLFVLARGAPKM